MQQLAKAIRQQLDLLVDQYDARLRTMPGYSSLPEPLRRDLEQHLLNTMIECLETGDAVTLVEYARQRATHWETLGLNLAWFQQALLIPEEILTPLIRSTEASNFLWRALNRSQGVVWQLVAERAQHTEERFRSIVETSHSGVLITDDAFHLTYVNDELTRISGYTREELLGVDFRQLLDAESRQIITDRYQPRQHGANVSSRYEVTFLRKDGAKRYIEMSAVALKDLNDKPYTVAQVLDVSERKQTEATLAQERNLLRTLIDALPDQIFVKDAQGRLLLYNQADARAMRVDSTEAALGKTVYDLYPRELAETYYADDMAVVQSDRPLYDREEPALNENGQARWVLTTKVPLKDHAGNRLGLVGIARDITERKRAEEDLTRSAETQQKLTRRLRATIEATDELMRLADLDLLYRRAVELAREKLGVERCGLLLVDPSGQSILGTYGTDEQGQTTDEHALRDPIEAHQSVFAAQEGFWVVQDAAHRHWEGDKFHVVGTGWIGCTAIRGETGPIGILYNDTAISKAPPEQDLQENLAVYCSMLGSIIERKRADQLLQSEKTFSDAVLNGLPGIFYMFDPQGKLLRWNQNMVKRLGYSDEEIARRAALDFFPPEEREYIYSRIAAVFTQGSADVEANFLTQAGEKIPHYLTGVLTVFNGAPYLLGIAVDISERKWLEQRIQDSLEQRSNQVQVGIQVAQEIAAAHDLDELLLRVVTLIKERFAYYHTQIFRYEPAQDAVVLHVGYGDIGQKMVMAGHKLDLGQGVVGTAAATGHSLLATDVRQSPNWRPNPNLPDTQGELAVPIQLRDQVLGILDVQSDRANALTDEDRLLLEGLCGQIASAMESTRLLERTETLYNISSRLNAAQTYDDILTTLRQYTVLHQADLNISLNLFDRPWVDEAMPEWSIALCRWSALPTNAVSSRYPLKAFSAAPVLLRPDEPTIITDVQQDPRLDDAARELYAKRFGAGSTIFVPLVAAGEWIGYVNGIFRQPRTFSEEETRVLVAAVGQASTVIESLRRLDELTTSESQLSEALRTSRLANWEYDVAADTFTFNDRFYALLRTTAEREGGYTMPSAQYAQRFVHPEDAPFVGREVQLAIEATDPNFTRQLDHRIFYADGEMGYFSVRFQIEKDAQGRTVKTFGANQDITERKQVEAEREQLLAAQQRRALQLQTASEVSRAASSILNAEELLPQAAELIRARFSFYYVGIFLTDETKRWAILQAGTGNAGQQMLINKHQLEIGGNSMIGQCIVSQQARIALDVGEEAVHFDNPLLPMTHSEMALPLISRGRIIGAMTIQSDQPAAFTTDDITVLQSMADQIANAVENARLYEQAQAALADTDSLLRASAELNVAQSYDDVLTVIREHTTLGRDALTVAVNIFDRPWTVHQTPQWIELIGYSTRRAAGMEIGSRFPLAAFSSARTLLRADAPTLLEDLSIPEVDSNTQALFVQRLGAKSVIFVPLVVGGQWVGYINVLFAEPTHFHEADVRRLEALVGQAAVAVQSMRNLAGAQQALTETDASYRATQAIGRAQSIESILEATTPVVQLMGMTRATLRMITRRDLNGVIIANDCYAYQQIDDHWILQPVLPDAAVNDFAALRSLLRNPEEVMIYKDAQNPNSAMPEDVRQMLSADGLRSAVATCINTQSEVLGFLIFSGPPALAEAAEQRIRLTIGTLGDQIAVALQSRRLFEQTRAALQEVDAINRRLTGETWEDYLRQQAGREVIWASADEAIAPETLLQLDDQLVAGEMMIEPNPENPAEATITVPILLRGQPIGALRLRTPLDEWTDDTQMMLADIADHIAQAVENARLIEQTQRTAQRERMINEINARVRQAVDLDAILRTAVNEWGQSLKAARVVARVGPAAESTSPMGDGRGKTNA